METTLRMFYARAFFLLAVLFLIAVAFAGVAFAQDAAAVPAAPEDYTGLAGLANSALTGIASGLALLVAAVVTRLWNMIPVWVRANIDAKQTDDSVQWRENIRQASYDALVHATTKLKIDPKSIQSWEEKNAMLALAGQFINRFDPDIKALIDKDGNGIPDVLEIALAKIAPQTAFIAPPSVTQGFMSGAQDPIMPRGGKPRASDEALTRFATKYAPVKRPRGTVTQ